MVPKFDFVNFDPKGIKYSFDVKNVINAFVGKDLYNSHLAALREAIQNGIDACNYKRALFPQYERSLDIVLTEEEIIISDNGQGMDEFIIENYFGKLASSYYEQESIKSEFQAIGQFGIGVFSYFLIADYIEIETKTANKSALKFRTDQDPNGYFHFFDKYEKEAGGSTLTLHLKEEYRQKIDFELIEKFVKKNFPFISFPIKLKDSNRAIEIEPDTFQIDFEKDLFPKMYILAAENKSQIRLIENPINTENFVGNVAIVVPSDKRFLNKSLSDFFNAQQFYAKNNSDCSEIKVSQKGVYINNYGGKLNYTIGKININTKLNINLNRSGFRNAKDIEGVISEFEYGLIEIFFDQYLKSIDINTKTEQSKATLWFLDNMLPHYYGIPDNMKRLLREKLVFKFLIKAKNKYLTFDELRKEKIDKILIIDSKEKLTVPSDVASFATSPVFSYRYMSLFSRILNYTILIEEVDNVYYTYIVDKNYNELQKIEKHFSDISDHYYYELCYVENGKTIINVTDNRQPTKNGFRYLDNIKLNVNSSFVKKIISNIDLIKVNSSYRQIIQEITSTLVNYLGENQKIRPDNKVILDKINILIEKLNESEHFNFEKFTVNDV